MQPVTCTASPLRKETPVNSKVVVGILAVVGITGFFVWKNRKEEMDFGPGPAVEASPWIDDFRIVEYGTSR